MTIPTSKGILCKQKTIVAERIIFSKIESIKNYAYYVKQSCNNSSFIFIFLCLPSEII